MSFIPGATSKLTPIYPVPPDNSESTESPSTQRIISALGLEKHIEGGYFAEIDRNPLVIPNPFLTENAEKDGEGKREGRKEEVVNRTADKPVSGDDSVRNASTSIYYMLSPSTPQGHFHRNKGRTVCSPSRCFLSPFFAVFHLDIERNGTLTLVRMCM